MTRSFRLLLLAVCLPYVPLKLLAITVSIEWYPETCGMANGSASALVSGGTGPYSFIWSTGANTSSINNLTAGQYSVDVTDAMGEQASAQVDIINDLQLYVPLPSYIHGDNLELAGHPCPGMCNGILRLSQEFIPGTPPYSYSSSSGSLLYISAAGDPVFGGFCDGETVTLSVTDANGCYGMTSIIIEGPPAANPSVVQVEGACAGGANGSVTLQYQNSEFNVQYDIINDAQQVVITQSLFWGPGTFDLNGLAAGNYTARFIQSLSPQPCYEDVAFTISDLGPTCGNVSGTLFLDHDQDCAQAVDEYGIPFRVIEFMPGPLYAITDNDGSYSLNLPFGTYTAEVVPGNDLIPLCPPVPQAPFTLTVNDPLVTLDLADSSLTMLDVQVTMNSGPIRPGFIATYYFFVENLSGQQTAQLDVTFTFDPLLTYTDASVAPSSTAANTVSWNALPELNAYGHSIIWVAFQVPPNANLIGTSISSSVTVVQANTETSLANNTTTLAVMITSSYDPNDKLVATASEVPGSYMIMDDEWLDYTIRFQNTGSDTAFTVVITDTLSTVLDMASFQQGVASHPFTVSFKPDRVVEWRFENILLPDSNVNEPGSHGLVSFRIRPVTPLSPGTMIENTANIYFDFNPPVITEPSVLVAEFSTGVDETTVSSLVLAPNPTSDRLSVNARGGMITMVRILAMDGREVFRTMVRNTTGSIDLTSLSAGPYSVFAVMTDGTTHTARIIKR